ncbi:hypothetical protein JTE90_021338 [Oedothorax gibbosus]|uniref:Uncharacterized protein n=1 Tax=Oedothorax gibbosus TaxID=931172 RepID=A0AAV6TVZ3_9ARAC|nr:hypothetical protein JTE90_021338 [Oedothorax gibbosus]
MAKVLEWHPSTRQSRAGAILLKVALRLRYTSDGTSDQRHIDGASLSCEKVHPTKKAVLITGCDTGFGFSLAKRLANRGFLVFAGCLSPLENGGKELSSDANIHCFKLDVTKSKDIELTLNFVTEHLRKNELWAVINNAGIAKGSEVDITPISKIEEVLDINLLGTIRITKALLELIRNSKGRIINVASAAGRLPMPGFVPYSTSKQAVIAFSDGLRMEMQKFGVSVITIEPWVYRTRLSDPSDVRQHVQKQWAEKANNDSYPYKYAEQLGQKTKNLFSSIMNNNTEEVIDAMEDAVTSHCPAFYYRPGKMKLNLALWLLGLLPKPVAHYILAEFVFKCL